MRSNIGQNFRLFSAILAKVTRPSMPHVLIKYAHVLICISAWAGVPGTLVHFIIHCEKNQVLIVMITFLSYIYQ